MHGAREGAARQAGAEVNDHPIRITVDTRPLTTTQQALVKEWSDECARIIWAKVRSDYYRVLFEMMAFGCAEMPTAGTSAGSPSPEPPTC